MHHSSVHIIILEMLQKPNGSIRNAHATLIFFIYKAL